MKFQVIHDYSQEHDDATITKLCDLLKVSRSGYYKWLHHEETESEKINQGLLTIIQELHAKYQGILGYHRMTLFVNHTHGTNYNKKRIRRRMLILGISSIIRRSRGYCTKTSFINIEENILNRDFMAESPNQKWCTDVTFLQSVIAYHISKHNDNPLVMENLRKAMEANPDATPLIHSDRGSQYTSREYRMVTTQYQMIRSMSRVGKCIDNAPIESFFGHFKTECYDLKKYKTFEELVADIDDYIYFYNNERCQERNNGLAPLEMRNKAVA